MGRIFERKLANGIIERKIISESGRDVKHCLINESGEIIEEENLNIFTDMGIASEIDYRIMLIWRGFKEL
jgi:hypothetical protein